MASGRINRNVPTWCGRVRREHMLCVAIESSAHPGRRNVVAPQQHRTVDRPSVTELPGLTSDPIYTADRRGGILMSSGPVCRPERVLNPSSRPPIRVRCGRVLSAPAGPRSHYDLNARLHLRASDRSRARFRRRTGVACSAIPVFRYLKTSNVYRDSAGFAPHATLCKKSGKLPTQISSRCSTPSFETLPLVISSGIQSGLSSGADSSQAQPS